MSEIHDEGEVELVESDETTIGKRGGNRLRTEGPLASLRTRRAIVGLIVLLLIGVLIVTYRPPENRHVDLSVSVQRANEFLWSVARNRDSSRLDAGLIINHLLSDTGTIVDGLYGHNDDALTTGKTIFVLMKLFAYTGNAQYLERARSLAGRFDPEIRNGVVFFDDDPDLYVDPFDSAYTGPEIGMVFWGFNGTRWLHPSDEQGLGAMIGLYSVWNVTREAKYADWARVIGEYYAYRSSSVPGLITSAIAYRMTGDSRFASRVAAYRDSYQRFYGNRTFDPTVEVDGHLTGVGYIIIGLEFPEISDLLRPVILNYYLPVVDEILLNHETGAIYYRRTRLPDGTYRWEGIPGDPLYTEGLQNTIFSMDGVLVLLSAHYAAPNDELLADALKSLLYYAERQLGYQTTSTALQVSGAFRPFYADNKLPAQSAYAWAASNLVSAQATVEFVWAAISYLRVSESRSAQ